ncbi:hypothetical protein [Jannaschia sp. 2305UL9-9]|uniref:hypothetical protein n=1 Tax=Jannaschia sp. 2305UL9-9 TaxID=3121638 RepID=UPI003527484B
MTQQNFLSNESGAVTVDWVVLTAALVGLGLAVMGVISTGIEQQSDNIDNQLTSGTIIRTAFTGSPAAARDTACTTYGSCDTSLSSSALQALTTADLGNVSAVTYGSDYASNNGMTFDGDGAVTSYGSGNATDYDAAVAATTAQNALIDAEKAARAN